MPTSLVAVESIAQRILLIRGQKVMLDADLAELYGVPTKALNQAVRRNTERFPADFMFQLSQDKKTEVVTNCDHLAKLKYSRSLPYAFTADIEAKKQTGVKAEKRQRGFSLVSAIFLLVVIAALGTFAVTLSTTQQQSAALDVQGARAYQAARAGIEWGAYQVLRNSSCVATTTLTPLPNTLAGFTVSVTCIPFSYTEAVVSVTIYQLTSTATTTGVVAGNPNFVERQMSVTIAQCSIAGVPIPCS